MPLVVFCRARLKLGCVPPRAAVQRILGRLERIKKSPAGVRAAEPSVIRRFESDPRLQIVF